MKLSNRLFVFVAALASFVTTSTASADVLLNDTMARSSRTAAPDATGAQWFSIGPGLTVSYAPNELNPPDAKAAPGKKASAQPDGSMHTPEKQSTATPKATGAKAPNENKPQLPATSLRVKPTKPRSPA